MDINDLFDGIMKSINQFAFDTADQRLQEKMQETGRVRRMGVRMRRISRRKKTGYDKFPENGVIWPKKQIRQ